MNLLLDLTHVRRGVDHVERRFEAAAFAPEEEFRVAAPVVLTADVRKDGVQVRLAGRASTTLELVCGRCLEPFAVPFDTAFDRLFVPEPGEDDPVQTDREIEAGDADVSYYRHEVISLGDLVRELCYLALPMKPLCREDCAGLCPVCGRNRNRETCTCQTEWVDPRLEPLRRLRSQ